MKYLQYNTISELHRIFTVHCTLLDLGLHQVSSYVQCESSSVVVTLCYDNMFDS